MEGGWRSQLNVPNWKLSPCVGNGGGGSGVFGWWPRQGVALLGLPVIAAVAGSDAALDGHDHAPPDGPKDGPQSAEETERGGATGGCGR